jgi:hypothetical protein
MISLAFLGPIPWMYCNAMITRLLVGILTPAMRATVFTPAASAGNRPADHDFPVRIFSVLIL